MVSIIPLRYANILASVRKIRQQFVYLTDDISILIKQTVMSFDDANRNCRVSHYGLKNWVLPPYHPTFVILIISGTPPNLVLKSIFEATFPGQKSVDYQTWFTVAFPLSLILIIAGWTFLCLVYARSSYWNLITGKFIWDKSGKTVRGCEYLVPELNSVRIETFFLTTRSVTEDLIR